MKAVKRDNVANDLPASKKSAIEIIDILDEEDEYIPSDPGNPQQQAFYDDYTDFLRKQKTDILKQRVHEDKLSVSIENHVIEDAKVYF